MTDPLKPHVLNNLANRAEHGIPHHVSLPAEMLMALIEEVRASRAPAMVPDEKIGRSRVVFLPHIADAEAPTLSELAAGTPVEGIEEVALTKRDLFRHLYSGTRPDEEALWQRFRDEGGKLVDEHGEVIATVGPAVPSPDDPYGFVAPTVPPKPESLCSDCGMAGQCAACHLMESRGIPTPTREEPEPKPEEVWHVVYDDGGAGSPCACRLGTNHREKQGHRTSWVEFDETTDFSKVREALDNDIRKLAAVTAMPHLFWPHDEDQCTPVGVTDYRCACGGTPGCGCRLTDPPTHFHADGDRYLGSVSE